jgi:hypothetical protein
LRKEESKKMAQVFCVSVKVHTSVLISGICFMHVEIIILWRIKPKVALTLDYK